MDLVLAGTLVFSLLALFLVGAVLAIINSVKLRRFDKYLQELTARLARLETEPAPVPRSEQELETGPAEAPPPSALPPPPVEKPRAVPATGEPPAGDAARPAQLDLETLIAGRWLNRIGIVAMMLAAAFFLKYAFDNDWVGPMGRVAIGLVTGTFLMVASFWFLDRGYRYFSEGIAALGGGVLFLSIFAAWDFYALIPEVAAFAGMLVVTVALASLAMGRNSERLAVLALGTGLITPGLLDTGIDRQITLFTYLAVLVGCFLVLAWRQGWRWVAPLALAGVLYYLAGWHDQFFTSKKLARTCLFATLFFAEFAAFLLARARSTLRLSNVELLLVPANAAWYGLALHDLLYRDHRWWLTVAVVLVGALHLLATRFVEVPKTEKTPAIRLLLAGLALTFVTAAIPIRLQGEWITIAWALEGALLVWAGVRAQIPALRAAGLVLFTIVLGLLLGQSGPSERLFFNQRFASFAVTVVALLLSAHWARSQRQVLASRERQAFDVVAVAANVVAVWGLSVEIWQLLGRQQWDLDSRLAQQMGLSLLWTVLACLLILVGVRKSSSALRWQGLVLLGITVIKVFIFDLSFLERAYRIASFLVLGLVLLAVSFWYQKSLSELRADKRATGNTGDEEAQ
jgi:uncharacterized membrane protein